MSGAKLITERSQVMGALKRIERQYEEPSGVLGNSAEERFVKRCAMVTAYTANPILTAAIGYGWKFEALDGQTVKIIPPFDPARTRLVTYTLRNAALWRAIKYRGIGPT